MEAIRSNSLIKLFLFLLVIIFLPLIFLGAYMGFFGVISSSPSKEQQEQQEQVGETTELAKKEIPADLLPIYKEAGQKYNIPWNVLAGIHWRETRFGRTTLPGDPKRKSMTSYANAHGPMQFTPPTWIDYGVDGNGDGVKDVWNEVDAIHSAANMLRKTLDRNGGDMRKAILRYNNAGWYADQVLSKANAYAQTTVVSVPANVQNGQATGLSLIWPTTYTKNVTSGFGSRFHPIRKKWRLHDGIDIAAPGVHGKPTVAAGAGKVVKVGYDPGGYGNFVKIDHGNGLETLYGHLAQSTVRSGQYVQAGEQVGLIGNTGGSTGAHLHFRVHYRGQARDPMDFLKR